MKKTIIALAVTSIFSTCAMASDDTYKEYLTPEQAKTIFDKHVNQLVEEGATVNYNDNAIVIEKDGKRRTVTLDGDTVRVIHGDGITPDSYKFEFGNDGKISKINNHDAGIERRIAENGGMVETTERELLVDGYINQNTNDISDIRAQGAVAFDQVQNETLINKSEIETQKNRIDTANEQAKTNFLKLDRDINSNAKLIGDNVDSIYTNSKSIKSHNDRITINKDAITKVRTDTGEAFQSARTELTTAAGQAEKAVFDEFAKVREEMENNNGDSSSYNKLYEAGSREVAKLETSLTAVDKGIRADGQAAYDKLRSEGGREVAKLESVSNALNKKMDLIESDGTRYVQEKADAAVEKSSKSLRTEGAKSFVRMEEKAVDAVGSLQSQIDALKAQIAENNNGGNNNGGNGNDVIEDDTNRVADAEIAKEIGKELDNRIDAAGAAAYKEADTYARATNKTLANHEGRISGLEKDMQAMGNKMLVLEDRMDGVVASSHAITNARPVLNSAGQFGMGVGMGAAGSKQAIAIGGAYQISDNWSGTMSVNYETKGKVSNDQLSAGVGAQYIF